MGATPQDGHIGIGQRLNPREAILPVFLCELRGDGFSLRPPPNAYFLNRFSNAARASFGRKLAGVDVSFSRVTRIS